ncbi:MAG: L-threonylcarbamoyladenylate synthase [Candidatus Omnitrophota bacterium]|nr:L-threonylcarbamoyladenylate synthase [Candidatus Omnitrophota bacterium]
MRTILLRLSPVKPQPGMIKAAACVLRNGGLVAFPTETVYGLGANLLNKGAVGKIYRIKKRPKNKPLTVHIADIKAVKKMVGKIPSGAKRLAERFWPGPLTLVLKDKRGRKTGFRMPDNRIAFLLIKKADVPIVAPSANISGNRPPKSAKEVLRDLDGKIDMVLDGGKTRVGIESTVVDMSGKNFKVLREGAISEAEIWRAISPHPALSPKGRGLR